MEQLTMANNKVGQLELDLGLRDKDIESNQVIIKNLQVMVDAKSLVPRT